MLKSSGGMTYVLDRLQDKGLSRRRPCDTDRRAIYAELTEEGQALLDEIFPLHAQAVQDAEAGLGSDQQMEAIELLKQLGLHAEQAPLPSAEEAVAAG